MSEDWQRSEPRDDRPSAQIIRERVEMLAAVFSRKLSDEMLIVFQEALHGYPKETLKRAFLKAERELDRFPTPKAMRLLCNEEMPSGAWKYHFTPKLGNDPETGKPIRILIDPDPMPGRARELYKAEDCPEGREFLAKLKEIAGKVRG